MSGRRPDRGQLELHADLRLNETLGPCLRMAMCMGILRFITAPQIWLALHEPSDYREECESLVCVGPVTVGEMETFHRQLFYWLMIR